MERPRDKHYVIKELDLPVYHQDNTLEQLGDWVLVAAQPKADRVEGVPVLDERHKMLMQRFVSLREAEVCSARYSQVRVLGAWALNLRTGETVRVKTDR